MATRTSVDSAFAGGVQRLRLILAVPPRPVVGHLQLGVIVEGSRSGHGGVDVLPHPVDGELHVGVDVPGVIGAWEGAGRGLDHVGAEKGGEVLVVEWVGDEEHIAAIWVARVVLLVGGLDEVSGRCSSSLYIL